jgi:hypothetical protein
VGEGEENLVSSRICYTEGGCGGGGERVGGVCVVERYPHRLLVFRELKDSKVYMALAWGTLQPRITPQHWCT